MLIRPLTIAGLLLAASAVPLAAQCPNGGAPPCSVAAAPRRDPPLDDRSWLILPFENTSRAVDAELIRQASVNLLYQEMSRWTDVRVVSDDRVADLMRDVPLASQARLGLEASLGLARHAGAGNLVVGDYIVLGGSAQIAARVYDVRSQRLIRTVRERLVGLQSPAGLDSLTMTLGRLGRLALNVSTTPGTQAAIVGTSSLQAFAAYNAGMVAWRNGFVDSAFTRFHEAIRLDHAYPMPRLRIWMMNAPGGRAQLDTAARASDALPARERMLVGAMQAVQTNDWAQVCQIGDRMVAADSMDAEAWFSAGACRHLDNLVVRDAGGALRFARSSNDAVRYYLRALELDPGHPNAIQQLTVLLNVGAAQARLGCASRARPCPRTDLFAARVRVDHDSFVTAPGPPLAPAARALPRTVESLAAWHWSLEQLRDIQARYVLANPRSWEGHERYGFTLLQLGDLGGAARELDASSYATHLPGDRRLYYRDRIELELRRERIDVAAAYVDSMFADSTAAAQPQYATAFGQFSRDQTNAPDSLRATVQALRAAWSPIFAGVLPARLDTLETSLARAVAFNRASPAGVLRLSTVVAFHARRTGPALDTTDAEHPLERFQAFFARGDTARARALLAPFDGQLRDWPAYAPDDAQWLIGAESWLELGDSTRALAVMQDWARRWPNMAHNGGLLLEQGSFGTATARLFPREWLLFGDLSMAAGQAADARRAYRIVVGFWSKGEPPVQPLVARAKAALAKLGN